MATLTYSEPPTRQMTPELVNGVGPAVDDNSGPQMASTSRATAHPPNAREIPNDFRSSLAAWWSSSGYRDARVAEDRLLRRLEYYHPAPPQTTRGWFSGGGPEIAIPASPPTPPPGSGLFASLKTVFIPTPDEKQAPAKPDMIFTPEPTESSQSSTHSSTSSKKACKHSLKHKHQDYINTLEISTPETANSKEAVVVLHGYAAALGFFFRNWDPIARSATATGRRAFFLDWLGMGLSSRPNPHILSAPAGSPLETRVSRAEHFFLSSLEAWRAAEGIDRMVLVGHSLGGYLATAYSLRYPDRVSNLILVSPAGFPHGAELTSGRGTANGPSNAQTRPEDVDSDSSEGPVVTRRKSLDAAAAAAEKEMQDPEEPKPQPSAFRRGATKMFLWGWEKGLSPFSILRGIGPWGPMLVGKYSTRRFAAQTPDDVKDLHAYIYGTSVLKGSGEYCISHLLAPGAYARMPMVDRVSPLKIPVTFMYGDNDWMDVAGGYACQKVLHKAGNDKVGVHVVPSAGHHLYLDNPKVSNRIIDEAIRAAPKI